MPDQSGRIFLITGGNSGMGFELAKILYQKNAKVYIACRSQSKALSAISSIKLSSPEGQPSKGDIKFIPLDLSDLTTIKPAAAAFATQETKLDVLWNNAGVGACPPGSKTTQGYELLMGTNALGHYLFTHLLLSHLKAAAKTAPAGSVRIVFTGSVATEGASDLAGFSSSSLSSSHEDMDPRKSYSNSKIANWFLASSFANLVGEGKDGIVSVCINPGNLKTPIWDPAPWILRKIMTVTMHPPIYGAYTALWAGVADEVKVQDGGRYAVPWGKWHPAPRQDLLEALKGKKEGGTGQADEFWAWCEEQTKDFA